MAAKEVMASAPLLVLLYDRAFVSGTFRAALCQRRKYYAALAATWLVLAACVSSAGFRGGTAGFAAGTLVTWWDYALTQCRSILIYIKLVFWPSPLVFEYDGIFIHSPWPVLPHIIAVTLLVASALFAMFRWPRAGIFGALFFAVLAPTSSFLPVFTQTMAERRMYLPSVAIIVPLVVACWWLARKRSPAMLNAAALAATALALTLAALTWQRNQVYQTELSLWLDTVQKAPKNIFAQNAAGIALIDAKRYDEGVARCLEATRLFPAFGEAWCYAGAGLLRMGRYAEAIPCLEKAVFYMHARPPKNAPHPQRGAPASADLDHLDNVYLFLAMALHQQNRDADARVALAAAVAFNPENAWCLNNLANSDYALGDYAAAETHYRRAIQVAPDFVEAHEGLAGALEQQNRIPEARAQYEHALRLNPASANAHYYYARLLARQGDTAAARAHALETLRLRPDDPKPAALLKTLPPPP